MILAATALLAALPASHATPDGGAPSPIRADETIRELATRAGLRFGAAVQQPYLADTEHMELVSTWANTLTFENDTKFGPIQPAPGIWDFSRADAVMDWAVDNDMKVRGHVLIWHQQNPGWLLELDPTRDEALELMHDHIATVVGHFNEKYPGVVVHWDVVNEAFEPDGTLRDTIWRRWIGDDYIAHAFRFAREAAGAEVDLYYNDYFDGTSLLVESVGVPIQDAAQGRSPFDGAIPPPVGNGATGPMTCDQVPKCAAIRTLLTDLVESDVPVDGMGFQAHQPSLVPSDYRGLTSWVGELDLEWALTEVDVPMLRDQAGTGIGRTVHQPKGFTTPLQSCIDDTACNTYITWGVSDRYTWWNYFMEGVVPDALPYDQNLDPKPSVAAIREVLQDAAANAPMRGHQGKPGHQGCGHGATGGPPSCQ